MRTRWEIFRLDSNTSVLKNAPAKLYEFLAVAVAGSIIIALLQGTPENDFLELLTFMAISAYRIMPSMSRLNGAIMQMNGQQLPPWTSWNWADAMFDMRQIRPQRESNLSTVNLQSKSTLCLTKPSDTPVLNT